MKRKFKQWWSTISPISIKRTTTFHFKSLNTKNKKPQDKIEWKTKITMSEMSRNPIDNPLRSKIDTLHTNIHEKQRSQCQRCPEIQSIIHWEIKSLPLTQIYMNAHFPGLVQALQLKVAGINYCKYQSI